MLKVFYSDHYTIPLPEGHRFPMSKYRMLRDLLLNEKILSPENLYESPLAEESLLTLAHDPAYVKAMKDGSVDRNITWPEGLTMLIMTKAKATVFLTTLRWPHATCKDRGLQKELQSLI
jgi:acetoin utilization deacetylase AcuC-like enzyme